MHHGKISNTKGISLGWGFTYISQLVSSPGRDSRDSRSSRLAEATQKALGTNALLHWFPYTYLVPSPHLSNIYKIVF